MKNKMEGIFPFLGWEKEREISAWIFKLLETGWGLGGSELNIFLVVEYQRAVVAFHFQSVNLPERRAQTVKELVGWAEDNLGGRTTGWCRLFSLATS
jgi:hypothetical protein